MSVCVLVYGAVHVSAGAHGIQKALASLELEL